MDLLAECIYESESAFHVTFVLTVLARECAWLCVCVRLCPCVANHVIEKHWPLPYVRHDVVDGALCNCKSSPLLSCLHCIQFLLVVPCHHFSVSGHWSNIHHHMITRVRGQSPLIIPSCCLKGGGVTLKMCPRLCCSVVNVTGHYRRS